MKKMFEKMEMSAMPAKKCGWVTLLCSALVCSCQSGNEVHVQPQLTDAEWNDVHGAVFLNEESLKDASARFEAIPGSDSVRMVLEGVHPEEAIEMNVAAVRDSNGDILFEGEQLIANMRDLKVKGIYRPHQSLSGTAANSPMVQVKLSYSVPGGISSKSLVVPFTENSGFSYRRHGSTTPYMSPESIMREDSCEFICGRIRSELARHTESLTFSFDENGLMSFGHVAQDAKEPAHTFRYWVSRWSGSGISVVHVENAEFFYECLLNALIPAENRSVGSLPFYTRNSAATLLLHEYAVTRDIRDITLVDDMHSKIFQYIYYALQPEGAWTDREKACFSTMERRARDLDPDDAEFFYDRYSWAFVKAFE